MNSGDRWAASILPASAVRDLQQAASTPVSDIADLSRVKEIESVTRRIKLRYAHLFRVFE